MRVYLVEDQNLRALAVRLASYTAAARYILFEFHVERAASTIYSEEQPIRESWKWDR